MGIQVSSYCQCQSASTRSIDRFEFLSARALEALVGRKQCGDNSVISPAFQTRFLDWAGSDAVHGAGFQIHKNSSWDKLASRCQLGSLGLFFWRQTHGLVVVNLNSFHLKL